MNDPNQRVLEAEKVAKEQEIAALEKQIEGLGIRVAVLSDTAEEKRDELRRAFKAKHIKRFSDIDVPKALAGFPAQHKLTLAGVSYSLRVPNGEQSRDAQAFIQHPVIKVADKDVDMGPVTIAEQRVLPWLSGVAANSAATEKIRDLASEGIAARLKILRSLPVVTIDAIARECDNLETFLTVSLELELGNFSPTP